MLTRREQAILLRLTGETYQSIAEKLGVSRQRVQEMVVAPKAIARIVRDRANDACQGCGITVPKGGHVHHRGAAALIEEYNDLKNLEYLCASCHRRTHAKQLQDARDPNDVVPRCPDCGACSTTHRVGPPEMWYCPVCGHRWLKQIG